MGNGNSNVFLNINFTKWFYIANNTIINALLANYLPRIIILFFITETILRIVQLEIFFSLYAKSAILRLFLLSLASISILIYWLASTSCLECKILYKA